MANMTITSKKITQRLRKTPSAKITWNEFRRVYFNEVADFMKDSTQFCIDSVFRNIEDWMRPHFLQDVTSRRISEWVANRRLQQAVDVTIETDLKRIFAALNWAKDQGFIQEVPKYRFPVKLPPSHRRFMRGRPLTGPEFQKMLDCCKTHGMRFFLEGLYWSGLRIGEALSMHWHTDNPEFLSIDFSQEYPLFRICAQLDKGGQDRYFPIAPEFALMLQNVPESLRHGKVFSTGVYDRNVVEAVCDIGRASGVVVREHPKVKYASAHDLRRSFGQRWSHKVYPADLMQLMRHSSILVTMRYYIGRNAQEAAANCWAAFRGATP